MSTNPHHENASKLFTAAANGANMQAAHQANMAALAQVQATLALAYEQRTANLIALYALEDGWQLALNRVAGMTHGKWDDVANQIVERLGLE